MRHPPLSRALPPPTGATLILKRVAVVCFVAHAVYNISIVGGIVLFPSLPVIYGIILFLWLSAITIVLRYGWRRFTAAPHSA